MISINNPNDTDSTSGFRTGASFPSSSKPTDTSGKFEDWEKFQKWKSRASRTVDLLTADNAYDRLTAAYDLGRDLFWSSFKNTAKSSFKGKTSGSVPPNGPSVPKSGKPTR